MNDQIDAQRDRESQGQSYYPNLNVALEILNQHRANGGSTTYNDGTHPTEGFAVGIKGTTRLVPQLTMRDIAEFIYQHGHRLHCFTAVGTYHDPHSNQDMIELSEIFMDFDKAIAFGMDNDQQSIYDFVNESTVNVHETEGC